ncbi:uncharacterized protein LOC131804140 isoform X2 [Musca domestica]|uniref:Uncharacterized protein LOC131804140 isoform X2 n=1 Tax=Musca domestica TaxID=7370 RepID=A0ABM3V9R8_MUSDO|nr:uncharacterized protein LOC131804140 isoform X2 [Musca domestica]
MWIQAPRLQRQVKHRVLRITANRKIKSWRRIKGSSMNKKVEMPRPPWRAVSFSTLPKPDKNALLRAKLLDASRRLRTTKVSVGVQTDILPSKLLKEVNLGAQADLVLLKEVSILTDGSYVKRRDCSTEYILTYSVSQMTDLVKTSAAATQTLLPRLPGDAFLECCVGRIPTDYYLLQFCAWTEQQMLRTLTPIRSSKIYSADKTSSSKDKFGNKSYLTTNLKKDSHSAHIKFRTHFTNLSIPPGFSWDFNYNPQFKDYLQQISSTTKLQYPGYNNNTFTNKLIEESVQLANLIEFIGEYRNIIFSKQRTFASLKLQAPADYWLPITCKEEDFLANLKHFKSVKSLNASDY